MFRVTPLGRPVSAAVRPPGSKSLTNRALVAAALADAGVSRIAGALDADDTVAMRGALRAFGVLIEDNDDPWLVRGSGRGLVAPESAIDASASGTTARSITAVAALATGRTTVDGTDRMRERPIEPLADALRTLGAPVVTDNGSPPITVTGGPLHGGSVTVDASVSSQFASALLLVAPLAETEVRIALGGPIVSRPYVDGTVEVMRAFGADVSVNSDVLTVAPTGYRSATYDVEADASAAVYPAVAVAITGGSVEIVGIPPTSIQADLRVLEILAEMGCVVARGDRGIAVSGPADGLRPVRADLSHAPDGAMALAVACLFADGPSRLDGLSTWRVKETDRLSAVEKEMRRLGADARVVGDALEIQPGQLHGAEIETYDDHRMAMSFAVAGLVVPGVVILNPEVVTKTWPAYFAMLATL